MEIKLRLASWITYFGYTNMSPQIAKCRGKTLVIANSVKYMFKVN